MTYIFFLKNGDKIEFDEKDIIDVIWGSHKQKMSVVNIMDFNISIEKFYLPVKDGASEIFDIRSK